MSEYEDHVEKIRQTYQRYREDFSRFFHQLGKSNSRLPNRYPGISYGHVLSALKNFEEAEGVVESIVSDADSGMARYITDYSVDSTAGYCQMKYIYFVGTSFSKHLSQKSQESAELPSGSVRADSLSFASKIVMYAMIAYLDRFLEIKGVQKSTLKYAMTRLILEDKFYEELGEVGCYLVYKCISTIP